jgi:hypothetical protein
VLVVAWALRFSKDMEVFKMLEVGISLFLFGLWIGFTIGILIGD